MILINIYEVSWGGSYHLNKKQNLVKYQVVIYSHTRVSAWLILYSLTYWLEWQVIVLFERKCLWQGWWVSLHHRQRTIWPSGLWSSLGTLALQVDQAPECSTVSSWVKTPVTHQVPVIWTLEWDTVKHGRHGRSYPTSISKRTNFHRFQWCHSSS